nr:clathrin heavy chain 2 [Delphinus delphis]
MRAPISTHARLRWGLRPSLSAGLYASLRTFQLQNLGLNPADAGFSILTMGPGRIPCAQDEPAQVVNAGMSDPRHLLHGQSADRATVHPASGRPPLRRQQAHCRPGLPNPPPAPLCSFRGEGAGCSTLYGSLTSPRSASPQKRREPTGDGTPGRHLFCWSPVMAASEPPGAWGGH